MHLSFKAFPRMETENGRRWSEKSIEIFKAEVSDKVVEVQFVNEEEGTNQW